MILYRINIGVIVIKYDAFDVAVGLFSSESGCNLSDCRYIIPGKILDSY